jgi:D-threo-aldose 1-dehydrogenase
MATVAGPASKRLVQGIGLGCAQLGNLYRARTDDEARAIVDAAWDGGVRYFDVAPHYGLGLAERRLGEALRDRPRGEYIISTKVGRLLVRNDAYEGQRDNDLFEVRATHIRQLDYSRDGVLRSFDASLKRLGLDHVDIVYVHDPDDHQRAALEGAFPALDQLKREGVISGYGAGMNSADALANFVQNTDANIMMLAGRYTLLDQSAATELLPLAEQRGVEIVGAGVFNSGILANQVPNVTPKYNYVDAPESMVMRVAAIVRICNAHSVTLEAAAANFPFTSPAVSAVVLGAETPQQATQNSALLGERIDPHLWDDLASAGLIRRYEGLV